ncbi:MAG: proteasome accessory factor PafA2 family protein [Pirellula sp.]
MGLETEYALRIQRVAGVQSKQVFDFDQFSSCLESEIPWARSFRNPERLFLANGGCLSLERGNTINPNNVLLESATPECQSPRELLSYQLALETLLAETLQKTNLKDSAQLMKGNTDAYGHTYGQHESYEMRVARGWRLVGWRIGLILLMPLLTLYHLAAAIWIMAIWLIGQAAVQLSYVASRATMRKVGTITASTYSSATSNRFWSIHPRWIGLCAIGLRIMHFPLAWGLWLNIYCFALVPHRRHLAAFFASRCILDGAGYLDPANRFWVSVRAAAVNSTIGFGSYRFERPIFRCDSWLRGLCMDPIWRPQKYLELFGAYQRVEIAIGDSGLCEQSQYVRIGSTALVLDMIEKAMQQTTSSVPKLRNNIDAIHRFSKDWMLLASVSDNARRQWTALDIQHAYASAVRHFLQSQANIPIEAWRILDQWQTTLNQLRPTEDESNLPRSMLGRVDWLSKLWLLHQIRDEESWQVRKKIDLRYHELSRDGYYDRLISMLGIAPLVSSDETGRARRTPPNGTPATQRGYIIREFADSASNMRCDWKMAQFSFENEKRTVRF